MPKPPRDGLTGSLLSDLPRGDPERRPQDFSAPQAEFFPPGAIADSARLAFGGGKIFLGVQSATIREASTPHGIERYATGGLAVGVADDRHMVTVAGTRAGKGRAAILPNILLYPGSVLATDPKGELATLTAARRGGMGQAVRVMDPFRTTKGAAAKLRASLNFIMAMRTPPTHAGATAEEIEAGTSAMIEDAALIADGLVVPSGKETHWDESASTIIEGVILHVRTSPIYEGARSLVTVRKLLAQGALDAETGERSMDLLEADMRENPAADGLIQDAAADFFDRPEKERDSVLSTARRHLKFLKYPGIRRVSEGHDFDLADLKNKRTTVYLCLPARHMGSCSRWLRMFVNMTLAAMERELAPPAGGLPVLFCLDEFASLGKMNQIEDAAGQIAGFGVKLWVILQDIGQLKSLYEDRWETFFGNAGVLQFFGNNDLTTLDWIAKRCGRTTIRTRTDTAYTYSQSTAGSDGEAWRSETHDLLTGSEAARIFGREDKMLRQLIIWAGWPPIILQRAYYDKHEMFQ